ncbi:MAG: hypothetical protein COB20_06010 [SAR86 cluster bacterium]|uniref:Uncharacterized protein n=1 Tax=SAR86 cluster bacterium TaxID=2030880 RepID=A0A2A4X9C1_9GAMM|nr:MAG: hypothetical protein COB20_06010 [SAR86 cluster bacterium]
MCGTCASYLDSGAFCEKCVSAVETEDFITAQSNKLNKSEIDLVLSKHAEDKEVERAGVEKRKDGVVLWLGFGGGSAMIFISLLIYAFPMLFQFDAEAAAAFEASQALEECRLVFEEIGYLLEDGEEPNPSLQCADSNVPNIVERQGDTVRVSHPNPGQYGLSAIYVSTDTHEVVLEG